MKATASVVASLLGVVVFSILSTELGDSTGRSVVGPSGGWGVAGFALVMLSILPFALPLLFGFSDRIFKVGKEPYVSVTEWIVRHPRTFWLSYTAYLGLLLVLIAIL